MFEVGKRYKIYMMIDGEETKMWRTVERYEHPIVMFEDMTFAARNEHLPQKTVRGEIVNVTSPAFISAKRED